MTFSDKIAPQKQNVPKLHNAYDFLSLKYTLDERMSTYMYIRIY